MVVQMGGGTSNLLRALQQQAQQERAERERKVRNIQSGVGGFIDAQATGQYQDNLARLAASSPELQGAGGPPVDDRILDPLTGAQTGSYDVAPATAAQPPSALSQVNTGGFWGRLYGGLQGTDAYRRQVQPSIDLALMQDSQRREDGQRMDALARQAAERQAMARATGMDYDPNLPMSAYDTLVAMRERADRRKADMRKAEERAKQDATRNAATRDALGLGDVSPDVDPQFYDNIQRMRAPQPAAPTPRSLTLPDGTTVTEDDPRFATLAGAAGRAKAREVYPEPEAPPKPQDDVAGYARARGVPYFEGMSFADVDRGVPEETKPNRDAIAVHKSDVDALQTQILRLESQALGASDLDAAPIQSHLSQLRIRRAVAMMNLNDAARSDIYADPFAGMTAQEIGAAKTLMASPQGVR